MVDPLKVALQGKDLLVEVIAEVSSVTKLEIIIKKPSLEHR
jgi:hypothetical protein